MKAQTPPPERNETLNPLYPLPFTPQTPKVTLDGQSGPTGGDTATLVLPSSTARPPKPLGDYLPLNPFKHPSAPKVSPSPFPVNSSYF